MRQELKLFFNLSNSCLFIYLLCSYGDLICGFLQTPPSTELQS